MIDDFGAILAAEKRQRRRRRTAECKGQKVKFEGKGVANISAVGFEEVTRINRPVRSGAFGGHSGRMWTEAGCRPSLSGLKQGRTKRGGIKSGDERGQRRDESGGCW